MEGYRAIHVEERHHCIATRDGLVESETYGGLHIAIRITHRLLVRYSS